MRPGDFSPGNQVWELDSTVLDHASMRPGDFSPGNMPSWSGGMVMLGCGFNEAGGFLPRKRCARPTRRSPWLRFNEAGGFLPRKPAPGSEPAAAAARLRFNEAGGFLPRKPAVLMLPNRPDAAMLQ